MVASRTNCDIEQLQKLLSDELSELDEARATDHVARCTTCRSRLEDLAAGSDWWHETNDHLHGSRWNENGTLWLTSRDCVERPDGSEQLDCSERTDGRADCSSMSLSFLEPSDNPAMLGRLGSYEILSVLGSGGFGIVLKGYDAELNRYVAVKVLAPHLAHSAAARKRFAREAKAAAAVVHPHIVAIHAVDASGEIPYLVMPLIAGESLQERLPREGPLTTKETLRIGLQVAQGLAAAHAQGVVHRDVKPANILLERSVDRVLLTDFGLARVMDDAALTRSTVIAGTPQYMSPEQAQGDAIDHRTDLFSLGSVLYTMCTGHPPFRAETLMGVLRRISDGSPRDVREINSDVPEWLAAIIAKLHAPGPDDRFQAASELAALLEQCLAHVQQPTLAPLPAVLEHRAPIPQPRRWGRPAIVAIATVMLVIGVTARAVWMYQNEAGPSTVPNDATAESPPTNATSLSTPVSETEAAEWRDGLETELSELDRYLHGLEVLVERQ